MTNYQGCKCPVCQKPFTDHDDIVVCPECGTPYHRECWHKQGGCVFADRHGAGFEYRRPEEGPQPLDGSAPSSLSELTCPACGAKNPDSNIFCESCGAPLHGMSSKPFAADPFDPLSRSDASEQAELFAMAGVSAEQEIDGIKVKDWAAYLGKSAPYYLMIFQRMNQTKRKIFPSFCGFLFGPAFLLYRKVWSWGIASAAASTLFSLPTLLIVVLLSNNPSAQPADFLLVAQQVCSWLNIILQLLLMLFSFWIIRTDSAKKIQKIRQESSAEDFRKNLFKKAAPSWKGILLYVGILILLSFALVPFFGPHLPELLFGSFSLF